MVVESADLRGRSVLDCGCGTGRLARALTDEPGTHVVGVDAEPAMLAAARANVSAAVDLIEGRAEALPFASETFERAVLWLVSHLIDRPVAFSELARVLGDGGRLAIVTFDPTHFGEFWLNAYFPSLEAIDRARFPTQDTLAAELDGAGFARTEFLRLSQHASLTRDAALERIRAGHISTFDLLDSSEVAAGRAHAERDLPGVVEYALKWLLAIAQR